MVQLVVPATLAYRDLAVRVVAAASKLAGAGRNHFDEGVVTAFGEAFNNVVLHAAVDRLLDLRVEIEFPDDSMTIRLIYPGTPGTDFSAARFAETMPPDPLAESGRGLFIINACMDDVRYHPADADGPNILSMTKRFGRELDEAA